MFSLSYPILGEKKVSAEISKNVNAIRLIKLSDNNLSNDKLSNNKLSHNNFASELVENRTF